METQRLSTLKDMRWNRDYVILVVIGGIFGLCIFGAWAWCKQPSRQEGGLRIIVNREMEKWQYRPEELGDYALKVLETTNYINGSYYLNSGSRVSVFAAEWEADSVRRMSVLHHTPDICWVKTGWKPKEFATDEISVEALSENLPFEVRLFQAPEGDEEELVVWTTLVGGKPLAEPERFAFEKDPAIPSRVRKAIAVRRVDVSQFVTQIMRGGNAVARKQFVRLSVPFNGDRESSMSQIKLFMNGWLDFEKMEH